MSNPTWQKLERILHSPARLKIMLSLQQGVSANFQAILQVTGLSVSNLSHQLSTLEEAGYVEVSKKSRGRRAVTWVSITAEGKDAIDTYWRHLEELSGEISKLSAPEDASELTGDEERTEEARGRGSEGQ